MTEEQIMNLAEPYWDFNDSTAGYRTFDPVAFARALLAAGASEGQEPVAQIVRGKTVAGLDVWDIKIFDKTLQNGTKLYDHQPFIDEFCKAYVEEWQDTLKEQSDCIKARDAEIAALRERIAGMKKDAGWISVDERLPDERENAYQVIVCAVKTYDSKSMYAGLNQRRFLQDWVVRRWPQNFTHWMEAMPWPAAPESISASKED